MQKGKSPRKKAFELSATLVPQHNLAFNPQNFLAKAGSGTAIVALRNKDAIFRQGSRSDAVYYIQKGRVKLTVVSERGKEATIALLGSGDFIGEECIAGQPLHLATATALTECTVLRIELKEMVRVLHEEHRFSELFVAYLLVRKSRIQADLVDQLFNSSEKRLARTLLLLAHFGKEATAEMVVPKISQETLAEMIGTTRSRVSFFMNRFRKMGFVDYNGGLLVHSSLLNIILHD
jgi:CRP/FNR family cyclic AMP-dependent transcriptional regulator